MSAMSRRLSRAGRILREVLLTCAALGGAICIVLAVLAFTGGYSLILFMTGSMTPTIPAGSVALVQRVPASELHVGDIVTVDRPDALPITHRVTSIADGASSAERVITLRGDANPTDDPLPYTVSEVRIVRGSVPYLAPVIGQFGNPWVLGGLTLGAALLVSWAFWPRRGVTSDDEDAAPDAASSDEVRADDVPADDERTPGPPPLRALAIVLVTGGALMPALTPAPAPASAASAYLVVSSDLAGAGEQQLDPVDPLYWHVAVDATAAPSDGELDISLSSVGEAAFGLRAEVRACAVAWSADETCASGERVLSPESVLPVDGAWQQLSTSNTPDAVYLRIALTADPADAAAGEAGASVTVRAAAAGETADTSVDGGGTLSPTGGTSLGLWAAPAAVLVGIGVTLVARRRSGRTPL